LLNLRDLIIVVPQLRANGINLVGCWLLIESIVESRMGIDYRTNIDLLGIDIQVFIFTVILQLN
jgi:hypothetical protein